jgi:uncharacterized YccA/Bax inhibitor family protein
VASPIFSSGKEFKPDATFEQMNAPVSAAQLQQQFDAPAATPQQMGRMSYEGVVSKTAIIAIGAFIAAVPGYVIPNLMAMWISAGVAFVVSLVVIFRKKPSPGLIAIYAIAEGYFLGAITTFVETRFGVPGAGLQALVATFATFAVVLFLYRTGKVRYTSKMRRMLMISGLAYLVFCLFNLGYMLFSGSDSAWGLRSGVMVGPIPLGVLIGAVAVIIACISLIADFDFIENAVKNGAPKEVEWKAAFGLILTLVWLYIEFLRIIAILFGRR